MSRLLPPSGERVGSGATPRKWVKGQVPCGLLGQRPDPSESLPGVGSTHGFPLRQAFGIAEQTDKPSILLITSIRSF